MLDVARIRTWAAATATAIISALIHTATDTCILESNFYINKVISVTYHNKVIKVIKEIKGEFRKSKTQSTRILPSRCKKTKSDFLKPFPVLIIWIPVFRFFGPKIAVFRHKKIFSIFFRLCIKS